MRRLGDAVACVVQAWSVMHVTDDRARVVPWLESACAEDLQIACAERIRMSDTPSVSSAAVACEAGVGFACELTGRLLGHPDAILDYSQRACALGYARGCATLIALGEPLSDAGLAVAQRADERCASGDVEACGVAARVLGTDPGYEPALQRWTASCLGGSHDACLRVLRVRALCTATKVDEGRDTSWQALHVGMGSVSVDGSRVWRDAVDPAHIDGLQTFSIM